MTRAARLAHWIGIPLVGIGLLLGIYFSCVSTRKGVYAVFLTNGSVYFGTISKERGDRILIKDVFYPQKKEMADQNSSVELVKLGSGEMHQPEDWMEINRAQILMLEKIGETSKVMQAMRSYKK